MGWFTKKEEKKEAPSLPELPKLPKLPALESNEEKLPQLPSFPSGKHSEKFSQDMIKGAVTGGKEEEDEADELEKEGTPFQMMSKPLKTSLTREIAFPTKQRSMEIPEYGTPEIPAHIPMGFKEAAKKVKAIEPIFIRIDKFEEALDVFEKAKKELIEIEKMLAETKLIKQKEEKELVSWETEIQTIKTQIQKVDKELFSKVE